VDKDLDEDGRGGRDGREQVEGAGYAEMVVEGEVDLEPI
jgi:hypothetical protein